MKYKVLYSMPVADATTINFGFKAFCRNLSGTRPTEETFVWDDGMTNFIDVLKSQTRTREMMRDNWFGCDPNNPVLPEPPTLNGATFRLGNQGSEDGDTVLHYNDFGIPDKFGFYISGRISSGGLQGWQLYLESTATSFDETSQGYYAQGSDIWYNYEPVPSDFRIGVVLCLTEYFGGDPEYDFDQYHWVVSCPSKGIFALLTMGDQITLYAEDSDGEDDDDMINVPPKPAELTDIGFVRLYRMTQSQCRDLASSMWQGDFFTQLNSFFGENIPWDAIINLGYFPFLHNGDWASAETITIGTKSITGCTGYPVYHQYIDHTFSFERIDNVSGSPAFVNYSPYVKVALYLPYIGMVDVPVHYVMNHVVSVTYRQDLISGGCTAFVSNENVGVFAVHSGVCREDVPISSSRGGHLLDGIMSAATAGASLAASGGLITTSATDTVPYESKSKTTSVPAFGNVLNTAQHAFDETITMRGSACGNIGWSSFQTPIMYITRPNVLDASSYASTSGLPCFKSGTLNSFSGFVQVDRINLGVSGATKAELEELDRVLKNGIII